MSLAVFGGLLERVEPCFRLPLTGFWSKLGVVFGSTVVSCRPFDLWSIKHVWRAFVPVQCPAQRLLRFEELRTSCSVHAPSITPYLPCSVVMFGGTSRRAKSSGLSGAISNPRVNSGKPCTLLGILFSWKMFYEPEHMLWHAAPSSTASFSAGKCCFFRVAKR